MRLSVLDQSPVSEGTSASQAIANTVDLAQHTERFGYHRYWLAEHHNSNALAGSTPEVLIGHVANATSTIRVGSGGVMLSHYSAYKVAENFRMLHTLYPDRIDLGVGRAPGSDQLTAAALAKGPGKLGIEYYPNQVVELFRWLNDSIEPDSQFADVHATPIGPGMPEMWVLASSPDSAGIAAHLGLPLAWAHFITYADGQAVCDAYRSQYQPSDVYPEPKVLVAASVICGRDDDDADRAAASIRAWRASSRRGAIPSADDAGQQLAVFKKRIPVADGRKPMIVGGPDNVREQLEELAASHGADELGLVTITHAHEDRVRSYKLIADTFDLAPST